MKLIDMQSQLVEASEVAAGCMAMRIRGRIDASSLPQAWTEAVEALAALSGRSLVIDLSEMSYCDGAGLSLFAQLRREMSHRNGSVEFEGGNEHLRRLLEVSAPVDADAALSPVRPPGHLVKIGELTVAIFRDLRDIVAFAGHVVVALAWASLHPLKVRGRDMLLVAEKAGVDACPVVILLGALVGGILAFQTAVPLQRLGGISLIPAIVAIAVVRELGPLITAIILAGRSGSAFAAEIGTMQVTEEINALNTFGLDPVRFLVIPRVLATLAIAPLLTILNMLASVLCGYVVMAQYGYSLTYYIHAAIAAINYVDLIGGLCKAPVFGLIVAAIGCVRGLQTASGPSAVGDSTTRAVVAGIVLIIFADMVFGVVYFYMGI